METPTDCTARDAKNACGFLVRVPAVVTQDKYFALLARQGLENGEDSSAHLRMFKTLQRIDLLLRVYRSVWQRGESRQASYYGLCPVGAPD